MASPSRHSTSAAYVGRSSIQKDRDFVTLSSLKSQVSNLYIFVYYIPIFCSLQVVFLGDASEYVPVPSLRTRNQQPAADDIDWQHPLDTWDREYRRFRFNNTRVQRKYLQFISGLRICIHIEITNEISYITCLFTNGAYSG